MLLTVSKIELRNWMTHRQETVELPREGGIVLLWGPSGAGKSSLLDAVGFSLFGLAATRASSLDELRHELYPDEDFGVRVTFALGEDQIQVFRGVEGGKTVVWMVGADGEMTEGPRQVAEQVGELMGGMDAATFFATYFSQQGELDALVRMAGGGRRKFVQRMMGITLLDKVTTRINRELVSASDRIKFLDESLPEMSKKELLQGLADLEKQLAENKTRQAAAADELEAVKLHGEGLSGKLAEAQAKNQRGLEITPKISSLQESVIPGESKRLAELEAQLAEAEKAAGRLAGSEEKIKQLEALEAEAEQLSQSEGAMVALAEAKQAVEELSREVEAEQGLVQSDKDSKTLQSELDDLRARLGGLQSKIKEGQERLDNLDGLEGGADCWVCGQHIADPDQLIVQLQKELKEAKEAQQGLNSQINASQTALGGVLRLEERMSALAEAKKRLAALDGQSRGADAARLAEIRAQISQTGEEKVVWQADRKTVEASAEVRGEKAQTQARLQAAKTQAEDLQKELDGLDFDPEALQSLQAETDQARERYVALRDQLADLRESAKETQTGVELAKAAADQYDAVAKDRAKAEERHGLLKRLEGSMKDFKSFMVGQIRPTLQTLASGHLSALTDGSMSGVEIDEDYNLSIQQEGGARRIGMCSGGEQARAAFALRLALTQLVSKRTDTPVGFMVFDEIFGSQDEGHRRAILESLRYLRGVYPQILLISHESSLRESDLVDTIVDVPESDSAGRIQVSSR